MESVVIPVGVDIDTSMVSPSGVGAESVRLGVQATNKATPPSATVILTKVFISQS